jgi:alpha-D-xyloside xylohydrolase
VPLPSALLLAVVAAAAACRPAAAGPPPGAPASVVLEAGDGSLLVEACAPDVIRVAFAKQHAADFFKRGTLATAPRRCDATALRRSDAPGVVTLATSRLEARIELATGAVTFLDAAHHVLLAETRGGRALAPATVQGEAVSHVRQQWEPAAGESLYGLGQHQQGLLDIAGYDLDLRQVNTEVFVPFLVSSRGWGILWDNTSFTRFGDLREPEPLPGLPYDPSGNVAGTTDGHVSWTGTVRAPVTGDYLFSTYASGDLQLDVDGRRVVDHWRQGWLPNTELARVHLEAGRPTPIALRWQSDIGVKILRLGWKLPAAAPATTSLWSEVGDGVDYTFVYGPELDAVVAGYRRLTGQAAMLPRWTFGFWQSRERYRTAKESLDVLAGYRARGVPIDVIVQDWQYYEPAAWGSHTFDARRFPDPAGWLREIHDKYHARLLISVWPKYYVGTANFAALDAAGFLYKPTITEGKKDFRGYAYGYYDAFDPRARAAYWAQIAPLFQQGVDAWWLDASEPETVEGPFPTPAAQIDAYRTHMHPTALGSGARVLNAYSLVNSQGVFEGQRAAAPGRRVLILTRNGFAGQQRYGAATWSGDISSTWTAMRKQIPAGLGFSLSGIPYWTMDSGGFSVPPRFASAARGSPALDEWRELGTRWLEWAAFLPIMRVHGQTPYREVWQYGGDGSPAYRAQVKADRLRYRLLPYIYTLAGAAAHDAGTILRPLVMDFRGDAAARRVADQFMLGPALMVSPVTAYRATSRRVYLPEGPGWYDFWTGAPLRGGQTIDAPAPFDAIPVHARAGAILPVGPELQFTSEKPADPVTLYVYAGADGAFALYEDDGVTDDDQRGAFARIPLAWSEARRTLTIGARQGSFPGMLRERTIQVVLVAPGKSRGFSLTPRPDATVHFTGAAVDVRLP